MKKALLIIKPALCMMLIMTIHTHAGAQKVNSVQPGSIWAPQGLKVDGKLTEWGSQLQAFNKTTRVWYTIANDSTNIYLAIKSGSADNVTKILAGGITFTINTAGKKKDKDAFVVTYPVITAARGRGGRGGGRRGGGGRGQGQDDGAPDSAAIIAQQKQTLASSKEISTLGFAAITDTLISIYNEFGIKAAASFDAKGNFVYELAVPLKMLNLAIGSQKEIAYDIKLNGQQTKSLGGFGNASLGNGMSISGGGPGGGGGRGGGGGGGFGGGGFGSGSAFGGGKGNNSDTEDLTNPTDFWGKYTLAVSSK